MHRREVGHIPRQQLAIEELHALFVVLDDLLALLENHRRALQRWHVHEEEISSAGDVEVIHEVEVGVHPGWQAL